MVITSCKFSREILWDSDSYLWQASLGKEYRTKKEDQKLKDRRAKFLTKEKLSQ
jgi:hypothetical protein